MLEKSVCPTIAVNTNSGVVFLQEKDIIYCAADGSYTHLFISGIGSNKLTVPKSLNKVLSTLNDAYFVRIHNSTIINLFHLMNFKGSEKNCVTMSNGKVLPVSRTRKEAFMNRFKLI